MFYSTDLLLRKDARFSLIWRLAVTNGHAGGTKKRQILAVNINSIVAELHQRMPVQPLTSDQQKNCFSLRLISQLLYGTCIVLQYQISNLHVDAKHVWDSCRHIRFDEKEKSIKRRKKDDKRDEIDGEPFPTDEPMSRKRKRKSEFDDEHRTEIHESQVVMGMDFLDRALINARNAYDITNITLPDDTMFIGGMNDPMFIQPDEDLIPTTDAMMDAFLNGEDTTFTTKEASENRTQEHLKNISQFGSDRETKRRRDDRAASEAIERHRASSHFSLVSMERNGTMQQPLMDDMMMMDDLNLSSSMAGIEGDTRTSIPAHFVSAGPLAVSTQVDPALEPILPSEPSQIFPTEHRNTTLDAPLDDFFMDGVPISMRIPSERDEDEEAKRASAGSEEMRRHGDMMMDVMEDEMMGRRKDETREATQIEDTPKVKRRRGDRDDNEEQEERRIRPKREPKSIKLDGTFMKESMTDYSDTLIGRNARRVKIDDKKKKKATELLKIVPTLMGTHLAKNHTLNGLFKLLKVDKIKLMDDHDPLDEDERVLEPWEEMEKERRQLERVDEEEEEVDVREKEAKRRKDDSVVEDMNQSMQQTRMDMDDLTMMDNMTMERMEGEHMSVATIEGDWEERNEYIDEMVENRYEEKELNEEEKRRLREERDMDEDEVEEARRRRTTGAFSDAMRMGDQMDLMDQFQPMMMDETRRSQERMEEGETRDNGERTEMMDKVEWRMDTEARVNKEKRKTMAQVENHEAMDIILSACGRSEDKRVTLEECIPVGANKATAARMFYNLLMLTKEQLVVPDQKEAYGTIHIGLIEEYNFPVYEEI